MGWAWEEGRKMLKEEYIRCVATHSASMHLSCKYENELFNTPIFILAQGKKRRKTNCQSIELLKRQLWRRTGLKQLRAPKIMSSLGKYNQQEHKHHSCLGCSWVLSEGKQRVSSSLSSPLHHCSLGEESGLEGKAVPRGKPDPLAHLSPPRLPQPSPGPGTWSTRGHLKPPTSAGAQWHPARLQKPPRDQVFPCAARGALQFPRPWAPPGHQLVIQGHLSWL